jgi:hypothetical protein
MYVSSQKGPVIFSDLKKVEFSRQIFEKSSNKKFCEIRSVVADEFQADRQTDGRAHTTKLIVVLRVTPALGASLTVTSVLKFLSARRRIPLDWNHQHRFESLTSRQVFDIEKTRLKYLV